MGYISNRKARLKIQLARVQASLTSLYNTLADAATSQTQSYMFDSGEGSQRTTRRKLSDIQDMIDRLTATENHLINELSNMGLVNVRVRRKSNAII